MVDTFFLIVGEDLPIGRQAPTISKKVGRNVPFRKRRLERLRFVFPELKAL